MQLLYNVGKTKTPSLNLLFIYFIAYFNKMPTPSITSSFITYDHLHISITSPF